jgi:competence protein ComEC
VDAALIAARAAKPAVSAPPDVVRPSTAYAGRIVLFLPVAMMAGVLCYFNLREEPPAWLAPVAIMLAGGGLAFFWRMPVARRLAALVLFASLGFGRAQWQAMLMPPPIVVPHGVVTVTGRVSSIDLLATGRRVRILAPQLGGGPALSRAVRVKLRRGDDVRLAAGDDVRVRAFLFAPSRPAYPGGWSFGRDQFFSGLGAVGFAVGKLDVTRVAAPRWGGALRRVRETIAARVLGAMPPTTGPIAATLLTGFEESTPARERQDFITAGLAHILAVAGLHIGIVMGALFALARFCAGWSEFLLLRVPAKVVASAVAFAGGVVYAALTGFHVPIERSLAMAALVLVGIVVGRRALSLRGLAVAAFVLMLIEPQAVPGPSFQMSFSAVLALIAGYEAVGRRFDIGKAGWRGWLGRHVAALAFTSLLAGGASMPFAAYQFQQVQPYYILANLIAVPLTALVVLPAGMVALVLMPLHIEVLALAPMGWGIAAMLAVARCVGQLPHALIVIGPSPGWPVALLGLGMAFLGLLRGRVRLAGVLPTVIGLAGMMLGHAPDVLVSPTASLVAVRDGPVVRVLETRRPDRFTLAQWRPVFAHERVVVARAADVCAGGRCRFDHGRVLYLADTTAAQGGCGEARVVISPEPLHGACRARGRYVIDRFSVWRDGAIALRFESGRVRLTTDRWVQGARPWVPAWPKRWHRRR